MSQLNDKMDFLKNGRTEEQYLKDIERKQKVEDGIADRFARNQGVKVKPASPRKVLTDVSQVHVSSDFNFEKFGLVDVKFTYRWHDELGFKRYQLETYAKNKGKILYVNGWIEKKMVGLKDKKLLDPAWILENGVKPSEKLKKLFIPKGKTEGKYDIALWADQLEWHPLL